MSSAWQSPVAAMPAPQSGLPVVLTLIADRTTVAPGDTYTMSLTFVRFTADPLTLVITGDDRWLQMRPMPTPAGVQCSAEGGGVRCHLPNATPALGTITVMVDMVDVDPTTPRGTQLQHEGAWVIGMMTAPVVTAVVQVQGLPATHPDHPASSLSAPHHASTNPTATAHPHPIPSAHCGQSRLLPPTTGRTSWGMGSESAVKRACGR